MGFNSGFKGLTYISKSTTKMQRFLDLLISINCSTCFRRFLRPSLGAQNCTCSFRYCQTNTAACCYRGWDVTHRPSSGTQNCTYRVRYCQTNTATCCYRVWDGTQFHLIHDSSRQQYWFENTWRCMYNFVLLMMEHSSISSTIAAGSSIGLTMPDAVCTVLCSWWWAEEPSETCRTIYKNK